MIHTCYFYQCCCLHQSSCDSLPNALSYVESHLSDSRCQATFIHTISHPFWLIVFCWACGYLSAASDFCNSRVLSLLFVVVAMASSSSNAVNIPPRHISTPLMMLEPERDSMHSAVAGNIQQFERDNSPFGMLELHPRLRDLHNRAGNMAFRVRADEAVGSENARDSDSDRPIDEEDIASNPPNARTTALSVHSSSSEPPSPEPMEISDSSYDTGSSESESFTASDHSSRMIWHITSLNRPVTRRFVLMKCCYVCRTRPITTYRADQLSFSSCALLISNSRLNCRNRRIHEYLWALRFQCRACAFMAFLTIRKFAIREFSIGYWCLLETFLGFRRVRLSMNQLV